MKKTKLTLVLALIVIVALVTPFATYATETPVVEQETETPVVTSETPDVATPTDETTALEGEEATTPEETEQATETLEEVKGNYFETTPTLVFNKAVDGNAFLSGDTVTIKGQVNGDVVVLAKDVILEKTAKIYGNLFTVCDNLKHEGLVYNLYAAATNYECLYEGLAALDIKVFADTVKFAGYTERSAYFISDSIELTDDAYILGNFMYSSANEPTIGEKATIYGERTNMDLSSLIPQPSSANMIVKYLFSAATLLGFVLLTLLVISYFKPNTLSKELSFKFIKCLKALGIGLLSLIVLAVITVLLFISVVFAKFATVLLGLIVTACMISSAVIILTTASILYHKFNKGKSKLFIILYAILVALVYFGLTIIPVAGFIIKLLINLVGFGLIIMWLFSIRKSSLPEKTKEIAAAKEKKATIKKEKKAKKEKTKKEEKPHKDTKTKKGSDDKKDTTTDGNTTENKE